MPRPHRQKMVVVLFLLVVATPLNAQDAGPQFYSATGFVSVSGKWRSTSGVAGDEPTFEHAVEIQCRLDIKECFEATAQIVAGKPQVVLQNYSVIKQARTCCRGPRFECGREQTPKAADLKNRSALP